MYKKFYKLQSQLAHNIYTKGEKKGTQDEIVLKFTIYRVHRHGHYATIQAFPVTISISNKNNMHVKLQINFFPSVNPKWYTGNYIIEGDLNGIENKKFYHI